MKTTLELPDDLMRRVRVRAAQSDQKLKDLVAALLEAGLRAPPVTAAVGNIPKPRRLRKVGPLTVEDIEAAIAAGRD